MKHMALLTATLTIAVLASLATADVPPMMNYQGYLTIDGGPPPDDDYLLTFRIYDVEVGGAHLWEEIHPAVPVTDGFFSVILGDGTPPVPIGDDVFNQPDRWLEIMIEDDPELTPRTRLVTVPYAFRISTVDGATGGDMSGVLSVEEVTLQQSGIQIAITGKTSVNYLGNNCSAEGRLGEVSGWAAGSQNFAVNGEVDPSALDNFGAGNTSFAVGGRLVARPSIGLTLDATGTYYVGGVYAAVTDEVNAGDNAIVAGVIGVDNNTGTANSFAGYFDGNVHISGDVGVGTTTPAAKLHDNGSIYTLGGSGDADLSGTVNVADFSLMIEYLNQNSFLSEGGFAEADMDGDGRVTLDDVAILERIMFYAETKDQAWRLIHSSYGVPPTHGGDVFYIRDQVGIGTDNPQGALDVSSTTGALIVPRMTTAERNALTAVNGMIIYNITTNEFNFYESGAWVTK